MNDEISKVSSVQCDFNKRYAIILLFALIIFVHSPNLITKSLWVEEGRIKNDFVAHILLPCVQYYLMLLCPIVLLRIKPELIAFDCIWLRWTRSEIIRLPLLVLGILLGSIVVITLSLLLNLPVKYDFLLWNNYHNKAFWFWLVIRPIFLSPVFEEVFWRGFVQSTITRALGAWVGVLGQALLFGLLHIYKPFLGIVNACIVGLVFGIWRHNRKTLLPIIIMHILRNLAAIIVLRLWYR